MELRCVRLKDFRRFDHLEAEFASGLNVVKGPQEAGKSTLHDAIILGLLDRPTGKQREYEYKAWNKDGLYVIELIIVLTDGQEVKIFKDYSTKTHRVVRSDGEDTSREGLEGITLEAVGTLSERMFISTACIRQEALVDINDGQPEISKQLRKVITGGGEIDIDHLIARLEGKVSELRRGWKTHAPRNPGPIKQIQDRVADLLDRLGRLKPQVEQREEAHESLLTYQERLKEINDKLRPRQQLRDVYMARQDLLEQRNAQRVIEERTEEKLEKAEQAEKAKQRALYILAELQVFNELDESQREVLDKAHETIQELDAQIMASGEIVRELESQAERVPSHRIRSWLVPILVATAGIVLVILGIFLVPDLVRPIGALMAVGGNILVLIGCIWLLSALLRRKPGTQAQLVAARKREQSGLEKLETAQKEQRELLAPLGFESREEYESKLKRYLEYNEELKTAEAALDGVLSTSETLESLKKERKEASRKRRDIEEQLEEWADVPELSALEYQKLVGEIASLEEELDNCRQEILRLEGRREVGGYTVEDLHKLEEQRASLERQLNIVQERNETYSLTLEVMRRAREYTMRTVQDELGPRIGAYVKRLTNERYKEVMVGDNLQLSVSHASKHGEAISSEELSQGTRDQLYLAARLALCDTIFQKARPPLLMDDPFVTFDPDRRDAAMRLCKELAVDHQIILFTCHDGYDEYADRVISLEGPEP